MVSQLLLAFILPVTVVIYITIKRRFTDYQNAEKAKRFGCKPPKILVHRLPFAVDLIYELFRADRDKVLPEYLRERFHRAGALTYSYLFLNQTTIFTIDPKDLQAILSTQFKDFSLGATRRANFSPFLGHGIFTEDGEDWERSRAMSPAFLLQPDIRSWAGGRACSKYYPGAARDGLGLDTASGSAAAVLAADVGLRDRIPVRQVGQLARRQSR